MRTLVSLARLAESLGYDTVWIGDSHMIWREAYVTLTACALATERVRLGTAVTNALTRDASVTAKAECSPPEISVGFRGAADVQTAGALEATLEANLGVTLGFKARLQTMAQSTGTISGSPSAISTLKPACIPQVVAAGAAAVADVGACLTAVGSISGSVGAS